MKNYYADPTANTAIARVEREMRQQKKREEWLRKKEECLNRNTQKSLHKNPDRAVS